MALRAESVALRAETMALRAETMALRAENGLTGRSIVIGSPTFLDSGAERYWPLISQRGRLSKQRYLTLILHCIAGLAPGPIHSKIENLIQLILRFLKDASAPVSRSERSGRQDFQGM